MNARNSVALTRNANPLKSYRLAITQWLPLEEGQLGSATIG